jgi:hypothetical protein
LIHAAFSACPDTLSPTTTITWGQLRTLYWR